MVRRVEVTAFLGTVRRVEVTAFLGTVRGMFSKSSLTSAIMADALQPSNFDEFYAATQDGDLDGFFDMFGDEGPFPDETKEEAIAVPEQPIVEEPEQPIVKDGVPGRPLPEDGSQLRLGHTPAQAALWFQPAGGKEMKNEGTIRGVYTKELVELDSQNAELERLTDLIDTNGDRNEDAKAAVLELIGLNPEDFKVDDLLEIGDGGVTEKVKQYLAGGGQMTDAIKVAHANMIDSGNKFDKFYDMQGSAWTKSTQLSDRLNDRFRRKPPPAPHEAWKEHRERPGGPIDDTRLAIGNSTNLPPGTRTDANALRRNMLQGKRQSIVPPPRGKRLKFEA